MLHGKLRQIMSVGLRKAPKSTTANGGTNSRVIAGVESVKASSAKSFKFKMLIPNISWKTKNLEWWKKEILGGFPKCRILIRAEMVKRRRMWNIFLWKEETRSLSDIAGHASFVVLAISYTETELLNLRMYAAAGVSLSMVFQYYRDKPLYLPLKWNFLFLTINIAMLGILIKSARDASVLPDEQKKLYSEFFQEHGMHSIEFMQLMSIAKRHEFKTGDYLAMQGKKRDKLHLIVAGQGKVVRDDEQIGTLNQNQFVGEMSYLAWEAKQAKRRKVGNDSVNSNGPSSGQTSGSMTMMANAPSEGKVETSEKGSWLSASMAWLSGAVSYTTDALSTSNPSTSGLGFTLPPKAAHVIGVANEDMIGSASVVCTEPCVVYTFSFPDLDSLSRKSETIASTLEKCMSADLNKKLIRSIEKGPERRYKDMMEYFLASNDETASSLLSEREARYLEEFRKKTKIPEQEHERILRECGWTKEEYRRGYRGRPSELALALYRKELLAELTRLETVRSAVVAESRRKEAAASASPGRRSDEDGGNHVSPEATSWWWAPSAAIKDKDVPPRAVDAVLSDDVKVRLLDKRVKDGIKYSQHMSILVDAGWSADDYERGCKQDWLHELDKESPKRRHFFRRWLND